MINFDVLSKERQIIVHLVSFIWFFVLVYVCFDVQLIYFHGNMNDEKTNSNNTNRHFVIRAFTTSIKY